MNAPTYDQYVTEIDKIRSLGAEPIIQIPAYNGLSGPYTADDAKKLLYYLNVTRGKNIKYVEIGNEPDKYPAYESQTTDANRAAFIAAYFRPFADSLKVADPNVKIVGPSFAAFNSGVYGLLLTHNGTSNIVDSYNSLYWLDIVDVHTYPFGDDPTLQTRTAVRDKPGSFASSVLTNSSNLLLDKILTINNNGYRSDAPLQFSITEMNIDYINETSNGVGDESANSFLAGQWMADMYSVILDKANTLGINCAFVCPWSIHESNGTASSDDLGILHGTTQCGTPSSSNGPRSTYRHIAAMGEYFRNGTFKMGTTSDANVKAFSAKFGSYVVVMIINEGTSTINDYRIKSGTTSPTSGTLKIKLNQTSSFTDEYICSLGIAAKTTHLVFFSCASTSAYLQTLDYDESDATNHAGFSNFDGSGNLPISITITQVDPTGCTSNTSSGKITATWGNGSGAYTYSWSTGASASNVSSTTNQITGLSAGTYTIYVKDYSGTCSNYVWVPVTVTKGSPGVSMSPTSSCSGSSVTYTVTATGVSPYTYSWSGNSTATANTCSIAQPTTTNSYTTYTAYVTDGNGCVNTSEATHYGPISASITGPGSVGSCCDLTLSSSITGSTYSWAKSGYTGNPVSTTKTMTTSLGSGTYSVTVTLLSGCSSTASKVVTASGTSCCSGPFRYASNSDEENGTIPIIQSLVPNPTDNAVSIFYSIGEAEKGELVLTNIFGQVVGRYLLEAGNEKIDIDCSKFGNGIYFSTIIVNGTAYGGGEKLVIAK